MPVTAVPAKGRLTPAQIAKLITAARATPGFTRHAIGDADQPGLFLVVGKRTASWTLKFRPRGLNPDGSRPPPSAFVIADAALISPDDARAAAAALRAKIASGAHPTQEKTANRAQAAHERDAAYSEAHRRAGMIAAILDPGAIKNAMALDFSTLADATLSQCVVAFDLHGSKRIPKTRADTKAHLTRALSEMDVADETKAADLKQARVAGLARLHADRPATGRHRVGSLNRLYKWLASVEAAPANPVVNIPLPNPPAPRTRVLTAGQVKALWEAAATLPEPRRDIFGCCCSCRSGGRNSPTPAAGTFTSTATGWNSLSLRIAPRTATNIGSLSLAKRAKSSSGSSPPPAISSLSSRKTVPL